MTNKKEIIGKVLTLVNNEEPRYTTKLLYVTDCETKSNNRVCLSGITMEIPNDNPSVVSYCCSNRIINITNEDLEKLLRHESSVNEFINCIYKDSMPVIVGRLDNVSKSKIKETLQLKYANRYAKIKTTAGNEMIVWINNILCIASENADCIVVIQITSHLFDEKTSHYKSEKFIVSVTLSELTK